MNTATKHLLESETTRLRLQRLARAMLGKATITVRFGPNVRTDITSFIELNPRLCINEDVPLWTQWVLLLGQLYHEVGHQFTEVDAMSRVQQPYATQLKKRVAALILNILEDSRIELLQSNDSAGCGPVLRFCNEYHLKKRPSLDDLRTEAKLTQFLEALLQRAVVGRYRGTIHDADVLEKLESLEELICAARIAPSTSVVIDYTHQVMALIDPFFTTDQQPTLPRLMKPEHTDATGCKSPKRNPEVTVDVHLDGAPREHSSNGDASEKPRSDTDEDMSAEPSNSASTSKPDDESSDDPPDAEGGGIDYSNSAEQDSQGSDSVIPRDLGGLDNISEDKCDDSLHVEEEMSDKASDFDMDTDRASSTANRSETLEGRDRDDHDGSHDTEAESEHDLEFAKLRNEAMRQVYEMVRQEQETEHKLEKKANARKDVDDPEDVEKYTQDMGEVHRHIKLTIRDNIRPNPEAFKEDNAAVAGLAKVLEHKLRQLFERKRGSIQRGQTQGRLDLRNLHKLWQPNNETIFYRRVDPEQLDVVGGLLIDESGSMSSEMRWHHARMAAILFHRVLQTMRIPHFAIGFTTNKRDEVIHDHFITFRNCQSPNVGYRLSAVAAHSENRDGYSIRVAANMLRCRPERQKFLVVVSDGQPDHRHATYSYVGEQAVKDTRQAVIEAERDGVAVIGVSIGEMHHHVSRIYRYSVIVPHVTELPLQFARILDRILANR